MTQHIEEAIERLKLLRKVGFGYDIKDEDRAAIDAVLSALAAAEERGRIAALEEAAIHLDEKALGYEEDAQDVRQSSDDRRFAGAVAVRLRGSAAAIRSMKEPAP